MMICAECETARRNAERGVFSPYPIFLNGYTLNVVACYTHARLLADTVKKMQGRVLGQKKL